MSIPKDKTLYEKAKKIIISKNKINSAYRSGTIVKKYKDMYKKKTGSDNAYIGKKKEKEGLSRWFKEDWKTRKGKTQYEKKGDIFRPTKKITKKTPLTLKEIGKKNLKKAEKEKKKTGKVKKFDKK